MSIGEPGNTDETILGDEIGDPYADAQIQLHRLKHGAAFRSGLKHLLEAVREVKKQPEMIAKVFGKQPFDSRIYVAVERRIARETTRDLYGSALVLAQTHISQVASAIGALNKACQDKQHGSLSVPISHGELRRRSARVEQIHHFANFWKHWYDQLPLHPPTLAALQAVSVDPKSKDALERLVAVLSPNDPDLIFTTLPSDVTDWVQNLVDDVKIDLQSKRALFLVEHSDTGGPAWAWRKNGREILDYEFAEAFKE